MKKISLFLMAGAALALGACSQDDPAMVETKGRAIDFRPAMGTRATETTNANLSSMYVTAIQAGETDNYFSNLKYSKGSDGFFYSTPDYFWPGEDTEITFYAYSPSQDELGADVTINNSEKTLSGYVTPENIADQIDFITATATGKKSTNETSGVELTFAHQLSQIEIQAKSENQAYVIKAVGARIGRPETSGAFDFATSTWTLDDWHETAVYSTSCDEVTLSSTPVSLMGTDGNAMLLPQTSIAAWSPTDDPDNVARETYLSALVNVATVDGEQVYPFPDDTKTDETGQKRKYGWVSIPVKFNWEAGKKYVYVLDFTHGSGYVDPDDPKPGTPVLGGPIKFTINVTSWDADSNETDIPMTVK